MINNQLSKVIFLVKPDSIGEAVYCSASKIMNYMYELKVRGPVPRGSKAEWRRQFFISNKGAFKNWGKEDIQLALTLLSDTDNSKDIFKLFQGDISTSTTRKDRFSSLRAGVKILLLQLWIDKVILLPSSFTFPVNQDSLMDLICQNSGIENLIETRGINDVSSLKSTYGIPTKDRNRRATQWIRVLLTTNFYSASDLTQDNIIEFLKTTYGNSSNFIGMYPKEFLLFLSSSSDEVKSIISTESIKLQRQIKHPKKVLREQKKVRKKQEALLLPIEQWVVDFSRNDLPSPTSLDDLYSYITPYRVKSLVSDTSKVYLEADPKVRDFVDFYTMAFQSWIEEQNLQSISKHVYTLNLTRAYLLIYLPHFFDLKYSNLNRYPTSFNEFSCSYFVSMSGRLLKMAAKEGPTPTTLIKFLWEYAEFHKWSNDPLYALILKISHFFDYVVDNSTLIANSQLFKNTISNVNFPKTYKRNSTAKKIIPLQYFATLINFLYTLEYLVEHINSMAYGDTHGVLEGKLISPGVDELESLFHWSGLWGVIGGFKKAENIHLHKLNYTPVFWHENKVYPLVECKRFYTVTRYEDDQGEKSILSPHYVRVLLLMCETGIRQQHLKWLDLSGFDSLVNDSQKNMFEPLSVNTDKSHGAWTARVNRRVIDVCRKQRNWYLENKDDSFADDIWYGGAKNSKFGKFKPLFRSSGKGVPEGVHEMWPYILLTFQKALRAKNEDVPEFVRFVKKNGSYQFDGISITEENEHQKPVGYNLRAESTPHALRATFVTEKVHYLPPSVVGEYFTGQTESLVNYYCVSDSKDFKTHEQLLVDNLSKGIFNSENGFAPEIAIIANKKNSEILKDVYVDPAKAVVQHGLISLSAIDNDKNGIEKLKAKKYTKLAFNDTHICPFNNDCPTEVIKDFGVNRPCNACPYAIRSCHHLPAISASKDQSYELAKSMKEKIDEHKALPAAQKNQAVLDQLIEEYDIALGDAFALEFTERQLYEMHDKEMNDSFIATGHESLKTYFRKIEVSSSNYLLKRLIDVQNFPSLDSPRVQAKFAHAKKKLLVMDGDLGGLLSSSNEPENKQLISQIKSLMSAHNLSVSDVFAIAKTDINEIIDASKPAIATENMIFALESKNECK